MLNPHVDPTLSIFINVLFLECSAVRHQASVHVSSHGSVMAQDTALFIPVVPTFQLFHIPFLVGS